MTMLTIPLTDQDAERLRSLADRLGMDAEQLAVDAVRARLDQSVSDDEFERIAEQVVAKNAELYRRLA
ncbi:MAG: DNA-binding protein [Bacteroidota bacterium]